MIIDRLVLLLYNVVVCVYCTSMPMMSHHHQFHWMKLEFKKSVVGFSFGFIHYSHVFRKKKKISRLDNISLIIFYLDFDYQKKWRGRSRFLIKNKSVNKRLSLYITKNGKNEKGITIENLFFFCFFHPSIHPSTFHSFSCW